MKQAANKDLRSAFATLPAAGAPNDDDGGDGDEDDSDEDDDDDGDDTDDGDGDEQDDDTSGGDDKKPVEDPEKQRLSREAAKWRKKYREAQKALKGKETEDGEDSDTKVAEALARANAAETRAALAELGSDLGITGEKNRKFVLRELKEYEADFIIDGTVDADELKAAIEQIVEDFPQVVVKATADKKDDDDSEDDSKQNGKRASGRQTNGKKKGDTGLDRETLAKKFPALRR